ncbi:hypothetical protein Tco_0273016 [Tanacetum coccineum]
MNETDGSGGVEGFTWIFSRLSFTSSSSSFVLSSWESLCYLGWIVTALIKPWTWVEHCGSSVGYEQVDKIREVLSFRFLTMSLGSAPAIQSMMAFNTVLILLVISLCVTKIVLLRLKSVPLTSCFVGFFCVSVTKLATSRLIDGSTYDGIDMVIKDLDLKPKVDAIMREFLWSVILSVSPPNEPKSRVFPSKAIQKAKIAVGERITWSIFRVREIDIGIEDVRYWTTPGKRESYEPQPSTDGIGARSPYYTKKDFMDYHFPREWEIARNAKLNPIKGCSDIYHTSRHPHRHARALTRDYLTNLAFIYITSSATRVRCARTEHSGTIHQRQYALNLESEELKEKKINWNKPPKEGDDACHIKIELTDPDREKFNRTFQSIPTTRKLSEKENPSEIIDLEHFYDS